MAKEVILTCGECGVQEFGMESDSTIKKSGGKKLLVVTYTAQCTNCDIILFDEKVYSA